jgi:hypothetical protein
MDMAHVSQYFTLDVLSTIAFGEPFGYMAANKDLWGRCYVFSLSWRPVWSVGLQDQRV